MIKLLLAIFLTSFLNPSFAQDEKKITPKKIEVVIGQDYVETLNFAPYTSVEIGNTSILDYRIAPGKRRLTLKGVKAGSQPTTVRVFNTVGDLKAFYEVTVTETAKGKLVQKLNTFLGDIEGINIGIKAGEVVLEGKIIVPDDLGRIFTILQRDEFKDVIFLVEMHPQTQILIARKMQEEIQKAGLKNVTVRVVNGSYWLEGVAGNDGDKARAELIAMAYFPATLDSTARREKLVKTLKKNPIENFIVVNQQSAPPSVPKLVKVIVQFVELSKDYSKVFGFKWIPLMTGDGGSVSFNRVDSGGVSSKSNGTLAATISNLFPKLASAKGAGHARIIQSGVIITEDKKPANLSKSSTKPFALGTGEFTKAMTATASFDIAVTPQIMPKEKIKMELNVNVGSTVGDPPETIDNKLKTNVVVKSKESAAIGGIVLSKTSTDYDRDPPFGTPQFSEADGVVPLFSFLRSKGFSSNRSQFAIFVTPETIESASDGTNEIKRKFKQRGR